MKTFLILWLLVSDALANGSGLQSGDLVFLSLGCRMCELIEKTTASPFSHVGIVQIVKGEEPSVIMAVPPQVMRVTLSEAVVNAKKPPVFMRMRSLENQRLAELAVQKAAAFLGRPYDDDFVLEKSKLYCSELIYFSFLEASGERFSLFKLQPMKIDPFSKEWEELLGHSPPEGKLGLSPGDLARSSYLGVFEPHSL